jgi:phosphatidylserine/phosphatidylglycerophosphate/cardiolipin synthase-like enzyme
MKKDGLALLRRPLKQLLGRQSQIRIVVALDPFGITDGSAVASLYKVLSKDPIRARMRYYRDNAFHPKLYIFKCADKTSAIVGSSNLTGAAMKSNIEANLLIEGDHNEPAITALTDYFDHMIWDPCRGELSDEILPKLRRYDKVKSRIRPGRINLKIPPSRIPRRSKRRGRRARRIAPRLPTGAMLDAVVIRYLPKARQAQFTREIIEKFFHLQLRPGERVDFQQNQPAEKPKKIERRTLVYSEESNQNLKFELDGVKILVDDYSTSARPIIVVRALRNRPYRYMVLLRGDEGYTELAGILDREPKKGPHLPDKITDVDSLRQIWPNYR